jgi:hypothetical protein
MGGDAKPAPTQRPVARLTGGGEDGLELAGGIAAAAGRPAPANLDAVAFTARKLMSATGLQWRNLEPELMSGRLTASTPKPPSSYRGKAPPPTEIFITWRSFLKWVCDSDTAEALAVRTIAMSHMPRDRLLELRALNGRLKANLAKLKGKPVTAADLTAAVDAAIAPDGRPEAPPAPQPEA